MNNTGAIARCLSGFGEILELVGVTTLRDSLRGCCGVGIVGGEMGGGRGLRRGKVFLRGGGCLSRYLSSVEGFMETLVEEVVGLVKEGEAEVLIWR